MNLVVIPGLRAAQNPESILSPRETIKRHGLPAPSVAPILRVTAACPGLDPVPVAFAIMQTSSRRKPGSILIPLAQVNANGFRLAPE
jgi:hypothetical protein